MRVLNTFTAACAAVMSPAPAVQAQTYPAKPIRFVAPNAAGMASAIITRLNGERTRILREPEIATRFNEQGVEAS
jgi:tripartite-type tricarboxylate transporter receptor subunit TctC